MIGGTVASFIAFLVVRPVITGMLEPSFPTVSTLAASKLAQLGFAVFLVLYFVKTRRWDEFVQFRRPDLADLGWAILGAAILDLITEALTYVLPLLGLSLDLLSTGGMDVGLTTWPSLWPVVFIGLYLLPALVEEQFYRGLLQGYLDTTFHPVSTIVLGALLYSLSHALYGLGGSPEFLAAYLIYLFGIGLAFCFTPQQSNNILVVAFVHAQSWTTVDFPFFGLF
jgi:membrane protease YdiL (CAAX protease family)